MWQEHSEAGVTGHISEDDDPIGTEEGSPLLFTALQSFKETLIDDGNSNFIVLISRLALKLGKSQRYLPWLLQKFDFFSKLQNQAKHLSRLLKRFILHLWPCYKQF
jgi:hypothetical protein